MKNAATPQIEKVGRRPCPLCNPRNHWPHVFMGNPCPMCSDEGCLPAGIESIAQLDAKAIPTVHADWYHDGIEGGRDLWRLDLPDVQIQVSINVTNVEDELDGSAPEYGTDADLFIEHDVRGAGPAGDDRTKYSCDCFKSSPEEIFALLAMSQLEAENRLNIEIRSVKLMPSVIAL